jgi:glycosyltransferase involved in cell wall biosynthesis
MRKEKKTKVKVLHVSQALGGVQTYILNIIKNNSNNNSIEYSLICPESYLSNFSKNLGIKVYPINMKRSPHLIDFFHLLRIIRIILVVKPDLLHIHSAKAGVLGRIAGLLTGKKVIFTPNAFSYLGFEGKKRFLFKKIEFFLGKITNVLLAVSNSEKDRARYDLDYSEAKIRVVPNSISIKAFTRDYFSRNKVGMIGRLIFQKNPELFVQIAAKIVKVRPETKFLLLGEGYLDFLKDNVYKAIRKNGLQNHIEILKWGEYDLEGFYNEIDIFLLTSRFEGLPFSILEAMERAIPIIATNVDGSKDVLFNEESGFLFDEIEYACQKILLLLDDVNLRSRIGSSGQKLLMDQFDISKNIQLIESIYIQLSY